MRERDFVDDFEDAWPKPRVKAVGRIDDTSRDFIFFHAAKPALPAQPEKRRILRLSVFARDLREPDRNTIRERVFHAKAQRRKEEERMENLSGVAPLRGTSGCKSKCRVLGGRVDDQCRGFNFFHGAETSVPPISARSAKS